MTNAFTRSWNITKITFNIIKEDKKLLTFPVLSTIFSLLFFLAIVFPTIFIPAMNSDGGVGEVMNYGLLFIIYLGLSFISTFFNVCVVYAVKKKLEGIQSTTSEILNFAFSKIHLILLWSLVSAIIGLILRVIESVGRKAGPVGKIITLIVVNILGMMWGIITVFVVPVMVYNNLTPFKAIKHSVQVLKKTWGESLIRHLGLGYVQGGLFFLGLIVGILLFVLTSAMGTAAIITVISLVTIYMVVLFTLFSVANTVFNTIIYVYGETGQVPAGYDTEMIAGAFKSTNKNAVPPQQAPTPINPATTQNNQQNKQF